jgi:hypothetical protein
VQNQAVQVHQPRHLLVVDLTWRLSRTYVEIPSSRSHWLSPQEVFVLQ